MVPAEILTDIQIAARFRAAVLITACPDRALAVAREIAASRRTKSPVGELVVCDLANGCDAASLVNEHATVRTSPDSRPILLLREVQALTEPAQTALADVLSRLKAEPPAQRLQVIASTSVPLFDRVLEGTFDDRLFYYLNTIHIILKEGLP